MIFRSLRVKLARESKLGVHGAVCCVPPPAELVQRRPDEQVEAYERADRIACVARDVSPYISSIFEIQEALGSRCTRVDAETALTWHTAAAAAATT